MIKVYYWKDIKWLNKLGKEGAAIPTREQFETDYVEVANLGGMAYITDPERIWQMLNLEPEKYFRKDAYKEGVNHTSMSVGDIVMIDKKYYIALSIGFVVLHWE